jgi:formylglycine-generating enzyme required for sulfatase activity
LKFEGEKPRKTAIERSFWLGRTEVTVGQWKQFASATNYQTDGEKKGESFTYDPATKSWGTVKGANWRKPNSAATLSDNHPVSCISWNDAAAFCEWLNKCEQAAGRLPPGYKICLPTEAEWEYACRGGRQGTRFWWGDAKEEGEGRLNWSVAANQGGLLVEVDHYGARGRNAYGLSDMLGNVWEWCHDGFDPDGAHAKAYTGDIGQRVMRGGSVNAGPGYARCAYRCGRATDNSDGDVGFRVACSAR